MKKFELERRVAELEAQNKRLVAGIKTGRFTQDGRKFYVGVEFEVELQQIAVDHCQNLLCDQLDNYAETNSGFYMVEDKYVGPIAGVCRYVVNYSFNQNDGSFVHKAYKAIEVL
jgi:hypothetical protein